MKIMRVVLMLWGMVVLLLAVLLGILRRDPSNFAYLAYAQPSGNGNHIYVAWPDGSHIRQITHNRQFNHTPLWSPDGEWLAYQMLGAEGNTKLGVYRMAEPDAQTRVLDISGILHDWAYDSQHLLMATYVDHATFRLTAVSLEGEMQGIRDIGLTDLRSEWSPVGDDLIVIDQFENREIMEVVDASTQQPAFRLVMDSIYSARWSPDGDWIAFIADAGQSIRLEREGRWETLPASRGQAIYRIRTDGSELQQVRNVSTARVDYGRLLWSPDARQLFFVIANGSLYSINVDGTDQQHRSISVANLIGWRGDWLYFMGSSWDIHRLHLHDGRREFLFYLRGANQLTFSPEIEFEMRGWLVVMGGLIALAAAYSIPVFAMTRSRKAMLVAGISRHWLQRRERSA